MNARIILVPAAEVEGISTMGEFAIGENWEVIAPLQKLPDGALLLERVSIRVENYLYQYAMQIIQPGTDLVDVIVVDPNEEEEVIPAPAANFEATSDIVEVVLGGFFTFDNLVYDTNHESTTYSFLAKKSETEDEYEEFSSTGAVPTSGKFTPVTAGTYDIKMIATNTGGSLEAERTAYVTATEAP